MVPLGVIFFQQRKAVFIIAGAKTRRRKTSREISFNHSEWASYLLSAFVSMPGAHKPSNELANCLSQVHCSEQEQVLKGTGATTDE